jgi:hypothetical protein
MQKYIDRIYSRIDRDPSGCWLWRGAKDQKGYGTARFPVNGVNRVGNVHRIVYEIEHGPIPKGLTLDHLCRNPSCVNPKHLEPVTYSENIRRGQSPEMSRERMIGNQHWRQRKSPINDYFRKRT